MPAEGEDRAVAENTTFACRGGTGFDVLKEIKKQRPATLVIILSRYSTDVFRDEAKRGGAEYFFDKSDEFESVMDVIRECKPK